MFRLETRVVGRVEVTGDDGILNIDRPINHAKAAAIAGAIVVAVGSVVADRHIV